MPPKKTDYEIYDALIKAKDDLPKPDQCESVPARTAIETARKVLSTLQIALLAAIEKDK